MEKIVNELLENAKFSMSKFQIEKFVINDQLTDYKKLKQCLTELDTRYKVLQDIEDDIELRQIDLDEIDYKLQNTNDEFKKRRLAIKKKRKLRELQGLNKRKKDIEYEIEAFEEILKKMIESLGVEKIKEILQNQENFEPEYWIEKFSRSVYADLLSSGRISEGLIEAISNLDKSQQSQIIHKGLEKFIQTSHGLNLLQNDIRMKLIGNNDEKES